MCDKIASFLIYEKVVLLSPASGALGLRNDAISCLISHNTAGHSAASQVYECCQYEPIRYIMFMWQWNRLMDWLIIYGMALKHLGHMPPNNMDQSSSADVTDEHLMGMMHTAEELLSGEPMRGFHTSFTHLPAYWIYLAQRLMSRLLHFTVLKTGYKASDKDKN